MSALRPLAVRTSATQCIDCGKCTPSCPVAERLPGFSPRKLIEESLYGDASWLLGACLACGACQVRCPSTVRFTDYVREARKVVGLNGQAGRSHGGMFLAANAVPGLIRRVDWMTEDLRTQEKSEMLFFVGCAPLFDKFFGYLDVRTVDGVRSAIRALNKAGIEPSLLKDDVCCGHDQLWSGDAEGFKKLAQPVLEQIKASGAKTVVTACAECARCIGMDYSTVFGDQKFAVKHVTQVLAEKEGMEFRKAKGRFTFQDPCRLSRHMGEVEAPRKVLSAIDGLELVEMARTKGDAICCGTEGFTRCSAVSKGIQTARLNEAAETGAGTLLTACPKCQVHFACAKKDLGTDIEIKDIMEVVSETLKGGS
ncbi:MAG: (Fe-S)-binding protein [Planctomycetota bacterium]|jgi:Fe-S oxidoreductase